MEKTPLSLTKLFNQQATRRQLQALCDLSNIPRLTPAVLRKLVHNSPDPETAVRDVYRRFPVNSPALRRKWRKLLTQLWSVRHRHLPILLDLPIAASDVIETPAFKDAQTFLSQLARRPLPMAPEADGEWLLTPDAVSTLLAALPSTGHLPAFPLENEWQALPLRRLRSLLESIRLLRRHRGQLVLVRSRYQKFLELPAIQQYYLLWHADAYHVDWSSFAGLWSDYIRLIQEYIPLLWSLEDGRTAGLNQSLNSWNQALWQTFLPLWSQEGLVPHEPGRRSILSLMCFNSTPAAVTQLIMLDLYSRFGLVNVTGRQFHYTPLGVSLLSSEHSYDLPCALDLLR
jgi:hypothetical protein